MDNQNPIGELLHEIYQEVGLADYWSIVYSTKQRKPACFSLSP